MRRALLLVLALVLSVGGSVAGATCASACSCAPEGAESAISGSDVVAEVTVVAERTEGMERSYDVEVDRVWKGPLATSAVVRTQTESASCGLRLTKGERYRLFASASDMGSGAWGLSLCSATARVTDRRARVSELDVVARLGEGQVPPPPTGTPAAGSTPSPDGSSVSLEGDMGGGQPDLLALGVLAGAALVLGGALLLLRRLVRRLIRRG